MPVLSLPCILGFNVWKGFHPLGGDSCVLDLEDFLVSDLALPLGGLAFALFCCHRFGWGWQGFHRLARHLRRIGDLLDADNAIVAARAAGSIGFHKFTYYSKTDVGWATAQVNQNDEPS